MPYDRPSDGQDTDFFNHAFTSASFDAAMDTILVRTDDALDALHAAVRDEIEAVRRPKIEIRGGAMIFHR